MMLIPDEKINHAKLKALVSTLLEALWRNIPVPPLLILGKPGLGKTQSIREFCAEADIGFIDLRLCQMDSCELKGIPTVADGKTRWALPSIFPHEGRGILFLDEITAADKTMQVAAYELLMERTLGEYRLPPGWLVIGAGNDRESRAVATTMSSALTNRFLIVELTPSLKDFLAYGEARGIHPVVLDFLRFRPKLLHCMDGDLQRAWTSPRSWERVSTMLKIVEESGDIKSLSYIVPGLVGMGAATEFLGYYSNLFMSESQRDIKQQLIDGTTLPLPEAADQAYALCEAVILFITQEKDPAVQAAMFDNFLANSLDWSSDCAAMVLNGIVKGTSRTCRRKKVLLSARDLPRWIAKHHLEDAACLAVKK